MAFELRVPGSVNAIKPPLDTWCFNGGLVEAWGKLIAVYRVHRRPTVLALSELDESLIPTKTHLLWDLCDSTLMPEDPRVIQRDNELYLMWTGVSSRDLTKAVMCHGGLDRDYHVVWKSACWFRWQDHCEKNWVPFVQDGDTYCLYDYEPFMVLKWGGGAFNLHSAKHVDWGWKYGRISGGAPPVWFHGRWYCFFHSSRREEKDTKVYYAGCFTMDEQFNVTAITQEPILAGSPHRICDPKPCWTTQCVSVVFPCGAVARNNQLLISYGYMDAELRIAEIPVAAIDAMLRKVA